MVCFPCVRVSEKQQQKIIHSFLIVHSYHYHQHYRHYQHLMNIKSIAFLNQQWKSVLGVNKCIGEEGKCAMGIYYSTIIIINSNFILIIHLKNWNILNEYLGSIWFTFIPKCKSDKKGIEREN